MFDASHQEPTRRRAAGRVRDRVEHAAAKRRWGQRFCRGRDLSLLRQNGGAPSSLTRRVGRITLGVLARETSPTSAVSRCAVTKTDFLHAFAVAEFGVEGTNGQRKEYAMARSKPSVRDALRKLREQRDELDAREARLRDEAAAELGRVLIECGAETLEPAALRQLIRQSMTLGIDETLKRLAPA